MSVNRSTVAAMAAVCVMFAAGVRAQEETKPIKVAVIDVQRVFDEYKKTKVLSNEMQDKFGDRQEELNRMGDELQERREVLSTDERAEDDPEFTKARQEFAVDFRMFEREKRRLLSEVSDFNFKHSKHLMAEIEEAVRRYAERYGYDLVIKTQKAREQARNYEEFMRQTAANPVIYSNRNVDITDSILTLLNAAYDKGISLVPEEAPIPE